MSVASRIGQRSIYTSPSAAIGLDTVLGAGGSVRLKAIYASGQQGFWVQFHDKRSALVPGDVPMWFGLVSSIQFNPLAANGMIIALPPSYLQDTLTAQNAGRIGVSSTPTIYTPTGFAGSGTADGWIYTLYEDLDTQIA